MTDKDKAAEYDRIADYLRTNGWSVAKVWKHPETGELHENWYQGDPHSQHSLMSAYKVECFKDAPGQGERMSKNLDAFNKVIAKKRALIACADCDDQITDANGNGKYFGWDGTDERLCSRCYQVRERDSMPEHN